MWALQQVLQMRNKRQVGRRHWEIAQVFGAHPFQFLAFERLRNAPPTTADIKWHKQMEIFVSVGSESEGCKARVLHIDAELFFQLADQRFFGALAFFDFAAGKFPQACQGFSLWSFGQEQTTISVDKGNSTNEKALHLAAVGAVDVDIAVGEIASPHDGLAFAHTNVSLDLDVAAFHMRHYVGFFVRRVFHAFGSH